LEYWIGGALESWVSISDPTHHSKIPLLHRFRKKLSRSDPEENIWRMT
jgi:hypothetical protein